jgi:hypothetical protein
VIRGEFNQRPSRLWQDFGKKAADYQQRASGADPAATWVGVEQQRKDKGRFLHW